MVDCKLWDVTLECVWALHCTICHHQQGRIDFNTVNPSLSTGKDFLIHSLSKNWCWEIVRAPPKLGRYWEIHPLRPQDFPQPSRGVRKSYQVLHRVREFSTLTNQFDWPVLTSDTENTKHVLGEIQHWSKTSVDLYHLSANSRFRKESSPFASQMQAVGRLQMGMVGEHESWPSPHPQARSSGLAWTRWGLSGKFSSLCDSASSLVELRSRCRSSFSTITGVSQTFPIALLSKTSQEFRMLSQLNVR